MCDTLSGKTALVAGTGPGIGCGIAIALAEAGASVVCADIDRHHAESSAEEIRKRGLEATAFTGDMTNEHDVERVVSQMGKLYGPIDVLLNGVAIMDERSILEMDYSAYCEQVRVILGSAFLLTKVIANNLIAINRGGSLIHLVSTAGHQGQADNIGYCTAKSGLLNFVRSAAAELGQHRIRVNTLTPTATDPTEGQQREMDWGNSPRRTGLSHRQEVNRLRLPLSVLPGPSHYGHAAVFLASDASSLMTGADLRIDSGALASYWAWSAGDHRDQVRNLDNREAK